MFFIGDVRCLFSTPFSSRWNAWVRDLTARLEGGFLIRSVKATGV